MSHDTPRREELRPLSPFALRTAGSVAHSGSNPYQDDPYHWQNDSTGHGVSKFRNPPAGSVIEVSFLGSAQGKLV